MSTPSTGSITARYRRSTAQTILTTMSAASLAFALVCGLVLAGAGQSTAAAPVTNGSDWGPQGLLQTDSPVTVRWDNSENPAESIVPRDASQVIPHSAGKTYADIDPNLAELYQSRFGADNGAGGLEVTMSQSKNLVNQSVTVSFEGLPQITDDPQSNPDGTPRLQIMQCWGAALPDGSPDAAATSPDPASCIFGATSLGENSSNYRSVADDPLAVGGDWEVAGSTGGIPDAPFVTVSGQSYRSGNVRIREYQNPFFNSTSSNELTAVRPDSDSRGSTSFEIQTTIEQPSLGCGLRADAPSVGSCWIVVVPRIEGGNDADSTVNLSALSPSVWGSRMQFRIAMRDSSSFCSGGQARQLVGGSEMLSTAMASWIPDLCTSRNLPIGFTVLGDAQARAQLTAQTSSIALVSEPDATSTTFAYAPIALSGVAIGFTVDDGVGRQVRDLKLNARLVAKLLTQSYFRATDFGSGSVIDVKAPWVQSGLLPGLFDDPEFKRLNPDFVTFDSGPGSLVLETIKSDAANAVWNWLANDPSASSFLNGCPDADGRVINPFYSTRTYVGCTAEKTALEKDAAATRTETQVPSTFFDAPAIYPPTGSTYPQIGWYERNPLVENGETRRAVTFGDLFPRVDTMSSAGRNAFRALSGSGLTWCSTQIDPTCTPAPGKWKLASSPTTPGSRVTLSITDTATAARFQLATASLCDSTGTKCVGATQESLRAAATKFEDTGIGGVQRASKVTDYAGGAYPLALPIYAVTDTATLTAETLATYRALVDYITGPAQVVGFENGQLPPGMAPLTISMVGAATGVSARLNPAPVVLEVAPPAAATPPKVTTAPRRAATPVAAVPAPVAAAAVATPQAEMVAQVGTTRPTEFGFPQFGLVSGLGAALLSGFAAPVVGRTRRRVL